MLAVKKIIVLLFIVTAFSALLKAQEPIVRNDISNKLEETPTFSYLLLINKNINADEAKLIIENVRQNNSVKQLYFNTPQQYFLMVSTMKYSEKNIREIFDIKDKEITKILTVEPEKYIKEIFNLRNKNDNKVIFSRFYIKK